MQSIIFGAILIGFGLIGVTGGFWNWKWLTEPTHNYSFIRALGPTGTRIFYIVLGIFLLGVGIAFLNGALSFGGGK